MASYAALEKQQSTAAREQTLAIAQLTDEVRVLRDVLDELREEIIWAIRNGRVFVVPIPMKPAESPPEVKEPEATVPERENEAESPRPGHLF